MMASQHLLRGTTPLKTRIALLQPRPHARRCKPRDSHLLKPDPHTLDDHLQSRTTLDTLAGERICTAPGMTVGTLISAAAAVTVEVEKSGIVKPTSKLCVTHGTISGSEAAAVPGENTNSRRNIGATAAGATRRRLLTA